MSIFKAKKISDTRNLQIKQKKMFLKVFCKKTNTNEIIFICIKYWPKFFEIFFFKETVHLKLKKNFLSMHCRRKLLKLNSGIKSYYTFVIELKELDKVQ